MRPRRATHRSRSGARATAFPLRAWASPSAPAARGRRLSQPVGAMLRRPRRVFSHGYGSPAVRRRRYRRPRMQANRHNRTLRTAFPQASRARARCMVTGCPQCAQPHRLHAPHRSADSSHTCSVQTGNRVLTAEQTAVVDWPDSWRWVCDKRLKVACRRCGCAPAGGADSR